MHIDTRDFFAENVLYKSENNNFNEMINKMFPSAKCASIFIINAFNGVTSRLVIDIIIR